ncbi:WXG100 family type VII secretion target [Spirillospora sp. CA-253888]
MSYTRANFGGLSEGEAAFSQAARALMDELNDLEGKLKTKLNQWEGGAQEAYWRFQKEWDTAAKDMQNVVSQLGLAIRDAHDNYQQAERANSGIWSG